MINYQKSRKTGEDKKNQEKLIFDKRRIFFTHFLLSFSSQLFQRDRLIWEGKIMNEDIWIYELSERLLIFEKNPRRPRKFSLILTLTLLKNIQLFQKNKLISWKGKRKNSEYIINNQNYRR